MKKLRLNFDIFNNKISRSFSKIYEKKLWNISELNGESDSGEGSMLKNTRQIRKILLDIFSELEIRTMLDASCGDWNWMKEISTSLPNYIGLDVYGGVIKKNTKKYSSNNIKFIKRDSLSFLKKYKKQPFDLILVRHTLEHLPTQYNLNLLSEVKKHCKYALITSINFETDEVNQTDTFGGYKPINLLLDPYIELLGEPYRRLDDNIDSVEQGTFVYLYKF